MTFSRAQACVKIFTKRLDSSTTEHERDRYSYYIDTYERQVTTFTAKLNELLANQALPEVLPSSYRHARPIEQEDQPTNILDLSILSKTSAIEATK